MTATSSATPTASPPTGAALTAQLGDIFRNMNGFTGAVLITRGDEVLLAHASGLADEKHGTPVTLSARFRIASITKQFTAMAILMLEHRGLLRLSDRVCRYVAKCPATWASITLSQLLTHTSGVPNFTSVEAYLDLSRHPSSPEHSLDLVRNLPLRFPPGSAWEYSNSGYVLLGMVVEKVSGTSYEAFLRKNIFDPLRMTSTGYDHGRQGVALGYASAGKLADPIDMSVPFSAGGLYSTVGDLHLWQQALRAGSLAPASVVAEMDQPRAKIGNAATHQYGYGVEIEQVGDPEHPALRVGHGGDVNGFVSWMSRYPEIGLDVVILSNHQDTVLNGLDDKIRQLVLGSS